MTAHVTQIRSSWGKRSQEGVRAMTLRFITEDGTQVVAEAVLSERQIMDMLTGVVNRSKVALTVFGDRKPTAAKPTPKGRGRRATRTAPHDSARLPIALPAETPAAPGTHVIEVHRAIPYTPANRKGVEWVP